MCGVGRYCCVTVMILQRNISGPNMELVSYTFIDVLANAIKS